MDYIFIDNLKIFAYHGVLDFEKTNGQNFFISAKLELSTRHAGTNDDLALSVDYDSVCHEIENIMTSRKYNLIESVAEQIADGLLKKYSAFSTATITIHKPNAPVAMDFKDISVTISRKWHQVYVSLGSNIGDSKKYLDEAIAELKSDENIKDVIPSTYITTEPYGMVDQPDFLNAAVSFKTLYTPHELLAKTSSIEQGAKRVREIHWGPRTLDVDILFYDDEILYTENLIIPHPEIEKREFVLEPLCELNPYIMHPVLNKSTRTLLKELHM